MCVRLKIMIHLGSSHTCIVTQDKWKNLQIRSGNPPKSKKKAAPPPEPSASAEEPEEIDISDSDDTGSRASAPLIRSTKKRRTAALVATASFAAVRNAELSQSQADSLDMESYQSPLVDNSYEFEEMVDESEGEDEQEQERDDSESRPKVTAAAKKSASRQTRAPPAPKPKARTVSKAKAPAPAPETASSVSTAKAKKAVRENSAEPPEAAVRGLAKFQFATDDTYPEVRTTLICCLVELRWSSNKWYNG